MITASEARKIALDEGKEIKKQFEEIEKYVNEAVFNGLFSVSIVGGLHPYVKSYLERIGYMVTEIKNDENPFYTINWVQ